jgi:hypothetical protein
MPEATLFNLSIRNGWSGPTPPAEKSVLIIAPAKIETTPCRFVSAVLDGDFQTPAEVGPVEQVPHGDPS